MSAIDLALRPACDEDAERIRVTASVDDVNRWLAVAQHRDRFHYATRPYLPAGAPGPARLRALQEQGLVILFQQRSQLFHGEFCYYAQRTARALQDPVPAPKLDRAYAKLSPRQQDAGDYEAGDRLLPILTRAAEFGRPCPTDKQLAQKARIPVDLVASGLLALRSAKLIVVHAAPAPTLRRVTILATGAQTGLMA